MRDWLWKYGPSIIRRQLSLKRGLKKRGYYPKLLGDNFVREYTEHCVWASVIIDTIDRRHFRRVMRQAPATIEYVVQHQHDLAQEETLPRRHWLVMRHLGHFQQDVVEIAKAERRAAMIRVLEEAKDIADEIEDENTRLLIGRALSGAHSKQSSKNGCTLD